MRKFLKSERNNGHMELPWKKKIKLIGYNVRNPGIISSPLEGKVEGKKCIGQERYQYVKQIIENVEWKRYFEAKKK